MQEKESLSDLIYKELRVITDLYLSESSFQIWQLNAAPCGQKIYLRQQQIKSFCVI